MVFPLIHRSHNTSMHLSWFSFYNHLAASHLVRIEDTVGADLCNMVYSSLVAAITWKLLEYHLIHGYCHSHVMDYIIDYHWVTVALTSF